MNIFHSDNIRINTIINNNKKNIKNKKREKELNKFEIMHRLVQDKLSVYLKDYRIGDIDKLNTEFTNQEYRRFGLILANGRNFAGSNINKFEYRPITFNKYRNTFHYILDGLNVSIINNNALITAQTDLSNANAILNDPEKMVEYYDTNHVATNRLEILSMTTTLNPLEFKEEYRIYLERYGIPDNLVFESEKLSTIILEIQNNGS
tara:strand:+ start:3750 stop:4367 length:618 start_codon:yes stop_codon:yes gene_type:complete